MRRMILWLLVIALGLAALVFVALQFPSIQDRVMRRALTRLAGQQASELFEPDALRVLLCGTSSPLPHPTRAKPCVAIFAGGRFYAVDVGLGSWNRLAGWRVDAGRLGGVLLTHFHSDHIGELGEFDLQSWVAGRPGPLPVYGPPGVERVVAGFEEAYALDAGYRTIHHGSELLPPDVGRMQAQVIDRSSDPGGDRMLVLEENGLRITAFEVDHAPVAPAYGYRFDYRGRSVVVSGDTVKSPTLVEVSRGADVLVHEAQANHIVALIGEAAAQVGRPRVAKIMSDIPDYHTTPVEAAEVANEAGVGLLVLYHLTPPPPLALIERVFVRGVSEVREDDWILADDGLLVELPVDSDEVVVSQLD